MEFDYESFDYAMNEDIMDVAFILAGVLLIIGLIALVVGLVMYILQSLGLYTIAKRRGIKHAWLAWLPVGSEWLIGCIADQYRYVAKGEVKNRRTIMLVLSLVGVVLGGLSGFLSRMGTTALLEQLLSSGAQATEGVVAGGSFMTNALVSLFSTGVSITLTVFLYISYYDLYTSCNPKNNVVFLVLGIIFPFLPAFFIFACRKKDGGMPPRKVNPVSEPVWQPSEPPKEPWENSDE